ncbi:hypothetical protein SDC9_140149 [bioreactor metagenome]|uniref:Uncharacterized protein n=1 Tax=bioreactor metagenome TaxID=1076179 RepID=A0A645DWM5_9ZZZZ
MKKLIIIGMISAATGVIAFAAQESPAPAANTEAVLKKTAHGRSMLARTDKDPEAGRFQRALSACIRYYMPGKK